MKSHEWGHMSASLSWELDNKIEGVERGITTPSTLNTKEVNSCLVFSYIRVLI